MISDRQFAWAAVIVYVALGIVLTINHEAWRDEADTWLMARDAPLSELAGDLAREGSPPLWDFFLLPFARTGFPYETQAVLQLLIASATAALFFFAAPFPRLFKLLIAFSYYMGYEYLAIARPYSLTLLLLFVMAALYKDRSRRPLVFALVFALFVNSTLHALVIGACIGPVIAWQWIRSRMRSTLAICIMAMGGLVAGLPMFMARGDSVVPMVHAPIMPVALEAIASAFAPQYDLVAAVIGVAAFLVASVALTLDRSAIAILWLSWAGLLFIYVFVYRGAVRHYGLLLFALIFALWIAEIPLTFVLKVPLYAAFVLSLVTAARSWVSEIRYPFSDAKNAATFLIRYQLARRPIAAHPPGKSEAVLAYLPPRRMWYPAENRVGSYMDWRPSLWKADAMPPDAAMERALRQSRDPNLLFLTSRPLTIVDRYHLRLLYATQGPVFGRRDERYYIYSR